jgi:hypothetical protein
VKEQVVLHTEKHACGFITSRITTPNVTVLILTTTAVSPWERMGHTASTHPIATVVMEVIMANSMTAVMVITVKNMMDRTVGFGAG